MPKEPQSWDEALRMLCEYDWDTLDLPMKQLKNAERAVEVQKDILAIPVQQDNLKLLRIQADLSNSVINTQLRIDETKLREHQNDEVLAKVLAAIEVEKDKNNT